MTLNIDGLPLEQLQKRKSEKWRRFTTDILPLPVAEMDFPVAEPIRKVLHELLDKSDLGYHARRCVVGIGLDKKAALPWSGAAFLFAHLHP